jgi:hypothetical protein
MFLAQLNGLNVEAADVGNVYLEAHTKKHLLIITGPEFGDCQGNVLVIVKAPCGLRTNGAQWHANFADTLLDTKFDRCKADPDFWIKDCGTHCWTNMRTQTKRTRGTENPDAFIRLNMRIVRVAHFSFITHVERQLCIVNRGYAIVTKQQ